MKRSNLFSRQHSSRRRAAVAVMTGVTLIVLLVFASFAVDLGFIRAVCGEMQHTADTAALAGGSALRETDVADQDVVKSRAMEMIEWMQKTQGFSDLGSQTIEVGKWDSVAHTFTPLEPGEHAPFAVRVKSIRKKTPYFFAAVIGHYSTDVDRDAVVAGSGKCGGIWGLRGVRVNGSVVTDSYRSEDGAYSDLTAGDNGDICSGRNVTISGGAEINGDVMNGFGYTTTVNGSSAEISGFTTSNSGPVTGPAVDFGDVVYSNDNATIGLTDGGRNPFGAGGGANMSIRANDNLTLEAGEYYLDSLTMRSGATITLKGPTTFYVRGNIDASGAGFVNVTADPKNLSIVSTGATVDFGGTFDFYGSILAPSADVTLRGDAQWYGAVIGGTVWIHGNGEFHVDESLPEVDFFDPPMPTLVE